MPSATKRTARSRRGSRTASARTSSEQAAKPDPRKTEDTAAAPESAEKTAGAKNKSSNSSTTTRSSHRGSRSSRSRRRAAAASAASRSAAEKKDTGAATAQPETKPKQKSSTSSRATRSSASRTRARKRAEEKASTGASTGATKARPPSQTTTPRAKVPVTGAPSEDVPPPFTHNAEYEFARILDFYGIEWQYEPRSFPLRYERGHVSEAFTPDFYLPDLNLYVELTTVKPNLTQEKNRKMRLLKELYPEVNVMLLKRRDYLRLLAKYGYGPLKPDQVPEVGKVLFSATRIQRRIGELGAQISHDYADTEPVLVGVLRGVMCFMADLMRNVSIPTSVDFMAISSYEGNGAAAVRILKDLDENIKGKDVILVEDIVDTGMTLNHVVEYLQTKRPRSVKVCTLLDKRVRRLVDVPLEYVGFEIPDSFVVGYGLDFRQRFRNLPFIATLKHDLLP